MLIIIIIAQAFCLHGHYMGGGDQGTVKYHIDTSHYNNQLVLNRGEGNVLAGVIYYMQYSNICLLLEALCGPDIAGH